MRLRPLDFLQIYYGANSFRQHFERTMSVHTFVRGAYRHATCAARKLCYPLRIPLENHICDMSRQARWGSVWTSVYTYGSR